MSSAGILLQHLLPHHLISRCVLRITRVRFRPVKNLVTRLFVRGFRPDMSDAIEPDPLAYPDFNAFFTRALRPGARPLAGDAATLVSPVDGTVSQLGAIDDDTLLQAKGRFYTLEALLAGSAPKWAAGFHSGSFATIYLAPYNYHRIHMPADGTLQEIWYVPGRLFSVNASAAAAVRNLFARNERLVLLFQGPVGAFAVIFVGALNVGSMATVWHGDVTPRRPRRGCALPLPAEQERFRARGEEIGRFNMGSTVILLFARDRAALATQLASGSVLKMGEQIGQLLPQGSRP
ncbi:MAG TPA: archaetidylserine decarboxylase [Steroidobacteraceae bacterium]|nr:archaetidylserine decarboxylase [Steroidobacteraceae bacterium]